MNQILDYNPNKSSGGGSSGSDKVTRVLAILLIGFAICLIAAGVFNLTKNNKENTPVVSTTTQAKITVEKKENVVEIQVSHDKVIEKLIGRIEEANTYFLIKMGSSIKQIRNLTPSQAQQLVQILKYGGNYEDIIKEISKYTNLNIKDIDDIFSNYAKKDLKK